MNLQGQTIVKITLSYLLGKQLKDVGITLSINILSEWMDQPDVMDRVWHYNNKDYFTSKHKTYNKFYISLKYFLTSKINYEN